MTQILFDKLAYVGALRAGGFTDQQAEVQANALDTALRESVAIKADITDVRHEIELVRKDTKALQQALNRLGAKIDAMDERRKKDSADMHAQTKEELTKKPNLSDLRREIAEAKNDMLRWILPLMLGQTALIVALIRFL